MKVTPGVTRTPVLPGASADGVRVDRFRYPPGGHTHWHLHTGEQVLYGESGRGWVQFAGKDRIMLESGGIVHVPVGLRHWHGAMPDSALVHLAVTAGGGTQWLGDVSAEEYAGDCGFDVAEPDDPLPASQTGDVVQCFLAAVARKDMSAALGLVTDDIVYDNVPIGTVTGPDGVRGALSRVLKAADRLDWITRHQVAAGNLVMNERLDRFHMDGRWVEVPVAGLFLLRNGKIALWRDYFDLATYQRQTPP